MRKKIILILAIFFITLLAISNVNASEIDNDDTLTANVDEIDNNDLDSIDLQLDENKDDLKSASNSNILKEDNPNGTFTDLINEIENANGELNLTRNFTYSVNDSSYNGGVVINKPLKINGNGFTIDGNNLVGVFTIFGNNVVLNNINFIKCYSIFSGDAIHWYGYYGSVVNCSFVNCSSSDYDGGAIVWDGVNGSVVNCSFVSCSARYGGAIVWDGVNGSVVNCSFVSCSASINGGAIHCYGDKSSLLNCSFVSCSAGSYGGAVCWSGADGSLSDSCFVSCSATYDGGAIYWDIDAFNGSVFNSSFVNCSYSSRAGAVCWYGSGGLLSNCSFLNCSANGSSGSVYWFGVNGSVFNCSFVNCFVNNIDDDFGAVCWVGGDGSLSNCCFVNCSACRCGAIYWGGSGGFLSNCSFVSCYAGSYAGAVEWYGVNGSVFNCSFVSCYAGSYAGGVCWVGADGSLGNCSFVSCSASEYGNIVDWGGGDGSVFDCSFVNCSVNNVTSYSGAGTVCWSGADGSLSGCYFVNSSINGNKSDLEGGSVYWDGVNGSVFNCSFVNSHINGNRSTFKGGAICWDSRAFNGSVFDCSFVNCSAYNGGAICWDSRAFNGSVFDCSFVNCSAYNGGAVYWVGGDGSLSNCSFMNCSANGSSGAVYWVGGDGSLSNCSFMNCSARYYGGGVCWDGVNGSLSNCCFVNCSATDSGGAVYWGHNGGSVFDCSFVNCSARDYGGAIRWQNGNGSVFDCSFVNCSANRYKGGAICWDNSAFNGSVFDCSFVNCYARGDGDAVYWGGVNGSLYSCNYNHASYFGNFVDINIYSSSIDYKLDAPLDIFINNIFINESANVGVNYYCYNNNITVFVYDSTNNSLIYNISKEYSSFKFSLHDLGRGIYNIVVVCSENNVYKLKNSTATFEVIGVDPSFEFISDDDLIAGENLTFNITLNNDAVGNINILINNKSYIGEVIEGKSNIIIPNIVGGEINYIINYSGDSYYNPYSTNGSVNVEFKDSFINFQVNDADFSQDIYLNPIVPSDATGIISIFLNDEFIDNFPAGQDYNLSGLNGGEYNITLKLIDDYYASCENKSTFRINKIDPNIIVDVPDRKSGDVDVHVYFETEAYGNITVTINNNSYTGDFFNNTTINIPNLKAGTYDYTVYYLGNQNLNPINETHTVTIELRESEINLDVSNITDDEILNLRFNFTGKDSAIISLYLNNAFLRNVTANENVNISNLKSGKYNITAIYNEDGYYDYSNDTKEFTVFAKSFINLDLNDEINYGEDVILNPAVTYNATGYIKIYVDNVYKSEISVGKTYNLTGLNVGNHTVKVIYIGDDNFASSENVTTFKVNPINSTCYVSFNNLIAKNTSFTVNMNSKASGKITVNINNKNYTKTFYYGKATFYIYDLPAGDYNYTIFYTGDGNFNPSIFEENISIQAIPSEINLSSKDIFVDEIGYIKYNLTNNTTGILSVYLNYIFIKNIALGDKIGLENLLSGNYTARVVYSGDEYYSSCESTTTFEVKKLSPTIKLIANNITAGDNANIIFQFDDDATGTAIVNTTNLTLTNAMLTYNIENIKGGKQVLLLNYSGNYKYLPFVGNYTFNVEFKKSSVYFTIDDIIWGNNITLSPIVSEGATGNLSIYLNGTYYDTMAVGDSLTIPFFIGGNYSLRATYNSDGYFASSSCTDYFNVIKLNSTCSIEGNIEPDNSATLLVTLNEDATGSVTITVNSKKYTSILENGVATFNIRGLGAGNYSVPINYVGDDKYAPITESLDLEVTLKKSNIQLILKNIKSGNDMVIKPVVTSSASGTIGIYVDNILKDTINVGSSYTLSNPKLGKHEVRVVYSGDSYHESSQNNTAFWVYNFYPIEVQNTAIINGTGKHLHAIFYDEYGDVLVNKYIAFNFEGKDYIRITDSNGLAVFDVDLGIGTYNITVINTIINEEYICKLEVFTSIESEDMIRAYNTGVDFEVRLLDESAKPAINQFAIFEVNGNNYAVRADNNGFASLDITLDIGTYKIFTINTLTGENKTNTITIVPSVYADNTIRAYNSGVDFRAKFLNEYANPLINESVSFTVYSYDDSSSPKEYNLTTDNKGFAILNAKLDVGEYYVLINNRITGEKSIKNLTIVPRIIENNNIVLISGEESNYTVAVVDDDGTSLVGANETVKITINGGIFEIQTDKDGLASFRIDENIGYYQIFAEYKEYVVYNDVFVLETVENFMDVTVNDVNYTENVHLTVNSSSFNRNARVAIELIGDNGYYEQIISPTIGNTDRVNFVLEDLNAGKYLASVEYYDFDNFKYAYVLANFTVFKIDPNMIVVVENASIDENATITVNIPYVSGYVSIKVGNVLSFRDYLVEDGVIVKNISNLSAGRYNVKVLFEGNDNYNNQTVNTGLLIIKPELNTQILSENIVMIYNSSNTLIATLKDINDYLLVGYNLTVLLDGKVNVFTTDQFGQIRMPLNNLIPGTYTAQISFAGDDDYSESYCNVQIRVNKLNAEITATNLSTYYNSGENITVTLKDENDNWIKNGQINISARGNSYIGFTDANGRFDWTVSLIPGTYKATIRFAGNDYYYSTLTYANIVVNKINSSLIANNTYLNQSQSSNTISARLVNDNNNPIANRQIIFNINNSNYYSSTANNGLASINVNNLGKGEYHVKVTFNGDEIYNPANNSFSLIIFADNSSSTNNTNGTGGNGTNTTSNETVSEDKIDTTLTVPDVVVVGNSTGVVVATLKDSYGNVVSGVNVKIVVGGFSKISKTNKKGQVSLEISGLAPGEYTISARSSAQSAIYKESRTTAKAIIYADKLDTILTVPDVILIGNSAGNVVATLKDSYGNLVSGVNVKIVAGNLSTIAKTNKKGQVSLDISSLLPGQYIVSARSSATSAIYNEARTTAKAIVSADKLDTTLTVLDVIVIGNSTGNVVATLKDSYGNVVSGVNVKIVVGSLSVIAKTDTNGQVSLVISGLAPGEYSISARSSAQSAIYKEARATAGAIVSADKLDTILTVSDVIVIGNSAANVVATLKDSYGNVVSGVNVKIVVGNLSTIAKTNKKGQVSLDISSLLPGQYIVSARSSAQSAIYKEARAAAGVIVSADKLDTTLTVPDVVIVGNSTANVVATLKDSYGNVISGVNVKIVVGSLSVIAKTDANGQVSLDISGLTPGMYTISARSSATSAIYKESRTTAKAIVSADKLDTILTVPDVIVIGNSTGNVVATLKDSYGNVVSGVNVKIVVGGLSVIAKTDANGQVSLDISGLAPGEYTISARSSATSAIYKESRTTAKAIVSADKIKTVLTAADVITTHNSGKKLVATLKDSYGNAVAGVKVRITVGTLDKILKTNSKGQVGLDVSTLDAGTYTATIKSAATDVYVASKITASVQIKT